MASKLTKLILILVAVSGLAACAQKTNSSILSGRGRGAAAVPNNSQSCSSSQQSVGRVYDNGTAGGTFEQRTKGLLSAILNPNLFGTISGSTSGQTGVTIEGHLRYDSSGNVILEQTSMKLMIYDSYVGQLDQAGQTIDAYPINFSKASSGTMNLATKQFTIQFKDQYGEITVTGVVGGSTVTGSISYQNYTSYSGGAAASGVLGAFSIATCGWVQ